MLLLSSILFKVFVFFCFFGLFFLNLSIVVTKLQQRFILRKETEKGKGQLPNIHIRNLGMYEYFSVKYYLATERDLDRIKEEILESYRKPVSKDVGKTYLDVVIREKHKLTPQEQEEVNKWEQILQERGIQNEI